MYDGLDWLLYMPNGRALLPIYLSVFSNIINNVLKHDKEDTNFQSKEHAKVTYFMDGSF